MTQSSVKRVSMADLGAKGFAAFVAKNEPVVVSDLAAAWPAQKSFAPAALAERFPEVRVSGMAWEGDRYEDTFAYTWLDDSLGAWIDRLSSKDSLTHAFVAFGLPALGPDALAEVGKLRAFTPGARGRRRPPELWLNQAGTVSPTHFQVSHNLLVQLHGRQSLRLYAPSQAKLLGHPDASLARFGARALTFLSVDPDAPDYARFPQLGQARHSNVELSPGEALFVPSRFITHTHFPTTSVALSQFWATAETYAKNVDVLTRSLVHRLLDPLRAG